MTNKVWMATCAAILGCTAVAMAQTQTTPPAQTNPASADKKVTITGCLAAAPANPAASATTGTTGTTGTAGTTGTTGAAGAQAESGQAFQLTNATVAPAGENAANPPAT